jgi:hypothetical protein
MMKKALVITFVFAMVFSGFAYALDINLEKGKLLSDQSKFTFGLGWAGNEFLGAVTKDGLDNPKSSFGVNPYIGFTYTWIFGSPSREAISSAIDAVVAESGGADKIKDYELKILVKRKMGIGSYTYFRFGTVYLFLPFVVQGGWMIPLGDIGRFQIGFGLPLLLNLGVNFDF